MKILIVSATEMEINPLIKELTVNAKQSPLCCCSYKNITIDFLITGVGSVFTTYHLASQLFQTNYDLVINAGIAGSFNPLLNIGDVVFVKKDQFADLGIEDNNVFYTLFEKGFIVKSSFPFTHDYLENPTFISHDLLLNTRQVSAITVNKTCSDVEGIKAIIEKFNPEIETMEGAAFFYVCLQQKAKFMQLRSISNYVRPRSTAKWNIPIAIENLNKKLFELLVVLDRNQTL